MHIQRVRRAWGKRGREPHNVGCSTATTGCFRRHADRCPIAGQFTAAPHIALAANPASLSPASLDFGSVKVNLTSGSGDVFVTNTSTITWTNVAPVFGNA